MIPLTLCASTRSLEIPSTFLLLSAPSINMSSYATQPTSGYSGIQPKFKDCVFDSSKEPAAFRVWLRLISGLVMSIAHGVWLETFLDNFLGRNPFQSSTRPAFLNDPALALDDSPQGNNTFPSPMPPTSESGGNSPLPSFDRATTQSRDGTNFLINGDCVFFIDSYDYFPMKY